MVPKKLCRNTLTVIHRLKIFSIMFARLETPPPPQKKIHTHTRARARVRSVTKHSNESISLGQLRMVLSHTRKVTDTALK